ncbi:MAG: H(+)/Cl(-) exchange transporter ClcA [Thermovenabulum sp.]|uniref:H(+)/Cl(-) exchange transporter ClcA n=1 Tax=Thermovenabulum sp. TaxID=3100335 RepID=UPI003C7EB960
MNSNNVHIYKLLIHKNKFKINVILFSLITGLLSGFIVILYRIAIENANMIREKIYHDVVKSNLPFGIALMVLISFIISFLVKKEPLISGSGIPQVRALILRQIEQNWLKTIVMKFIGGVLSIGAGLSLGREGPSIQLGASMGQGVSLLFKKTKVEERYLITAGASAGLAAAFNAPLAGVIFALEELHKNFSPIVLLSSMSAAIMADFISKKFFGLKPIFDFKNISPLPLNNYFLLVIFGIIIGIFGYIFNVFLIKSLNIYSKFNKVPFSIKMMFPIALSGLLMFILPNVLGGGHNLIVSIINDNNTLLFLSILFIVKFVFTMISYGSGAPGGIFLPLLAIGAIIGAIYSKIAISYFGISNIFYKNFIILGMAGYFTAIVRAPITGSILITEMTGSFTHLLSLITVSIVSYITAEILGSKPIYEELLDRILSNKKSIPLKESNKKTLLEICVCTGSELERKKVKEIKWPSNCLLVAIRRGEKEIIPKGNTLIYEGDYLIILTDETYAPIVKESLLKMACSLN